MREKKKLWKNEKMNEQFVREMRETTDEKETCWEKADLKIETEAMLCKHKIEKTAQSPVWVTPSKSGHEGLEKNLCDWSRLWIYYTLCPSVISFNKNLSYQQINKPSWCISLQ